MQNECDLRRYAAEIRIETVRQLESFGSGHIGGSASIADALAALYGKVLNIRPEQPDWEGRDYLVMSKGHCGPALYAALSLKGYFDKEWLKTLNRFGTRLPSHCDRNRTPGIDVSTGSLGQGVSVACGMALALRLLKKDNFVFAIAGDGEVQEGQVWEAAEFAAQNRLDHLVLLVDVNGAQLDGRTKDICDNRDLKAKYVDFGWESYNVKGYDVEGIAELLMNLKQECPNGRPKAVLLETRKGIGITFAEKEALCHHMKVSAADAEEAIAEIRRRYTNGCYPGGETIE